MQIWLGCTMDDKETRKMKQLDQLFVELLVYIYSDRNSILNSKLYLIVV